MARRHDALIPLSHDHRAALALAFRLHNPAPPGPVTPLTPASTPGSRRVETLAFFRDNLIQHFAIEEELLFAELLKACAATSALETLIAELTADHRHMEMLRDEIEKAAEDESIGRALSSFADALEQHVRREERKLFASFPGPLAEQVVADLQQAICARRPPDQRVDKKCRVPSRPT